MVPSPFFSKNKSQMSEVSRRITIYLETGDAEAAQVRLEAKQQKLLQTITKLKEQSAKYNKEIAEGSKTSEAALARNNTQLANTSKELDKTTQALERTNLKVAGVLSPSFNELNATVRKLGMELKTLSSDDTGFELKKKQYLDAKKALDQYANSISVTKNGLKDMLSTAKGVAVGVLVGGALQAAGAALLAGIQTVFKANTELDASVKNLSAITGATGNDLDFLKQKAIDLGSTGARGAKDYVEAMKLIGSAKPELLSNKEGLVEVTKAAKLLANASGLELPDAAKRLTDALNQYGAPAEEATKYVDALAAAAKYGAAEVPQVTDALLEFGTQAKSSNISIYESTAAIELLAEKGIKGAEAGTQLRNVFLRMSAVNSLSKEALTSLAQAGVNTKILTDNTLSLETRLKEFGKISNDTTALVNVFGKENFNAGQIVLQNIPRYAQLAEQIKETGVASTQAGVNTATLSNQWERLKNTITTLFLGIDTSPLAGIVGAFADAARAAGEYFGIIKSGSQLMEQERVDLLKTEVAITSLNVGSTERVKLIDELKARYPEYLAGLDSERATNEEIHKALKLVNDEMLIKIALQKQQEELDKALKVTGEGLAESAKARALLQTQFAQDLDHIKEYNPLLAEKIKQQTDGLSVEEKIRRVIERKIDLSKGERDALVKSVDLYNKLNGAQRDFLAAKFDSDALKKYMDTLKKAMEETLAANRAKSNVIGEVTVTGTKVSKPSGTSGKSDAQKKEEDDLKKFLEELRKLREDASLQQMGLDAKEILAAQEKYEKLYQFAVAHWGRNGKYTQEIEKFYADDVNEKLDKQSAAKWEKGYEQRRTVMEQFWNSVKETAKGNKAVELEIERQKLEAIVLLDAQYASVSKKAKQDSIKDAKALADIEFQIAVEEATRKRKAIQDIDAGDVAAATRSKNASAIRDAKLQQLYDNYQIELQLHGDTEEAKYKITEEYLLRRQGLEEEYANSAIAANQKILSNIQEYAGFAVGIFSDLNNVLTTIENNQLANDKRANDKKKAQFKAQLDSKHITQKQYDAKAAQLDKEYDEKEREIKVKQFNRNKGLKIAEAVIGTATSAISAYNAGLSVGGPAGLILGPIMAAIAVGFGVVKTAMIAAEQPPSYAMGDVFGGSSHSDGGNPVYDSKTGRKIAEVEEGEFITRKSAVGKNLALLRYINENGSNISILEQLPAMMSRPSINSDRAISNLRFERGGQYGIQPKPSEDIKAVNSFNYEKNDALIGEMKLQNAMLKQMVDHLATLNNKEFGINYQQFKKLDNTIQTTQKVSGL